MNDFESEYQDVKREYIHADFCLLTITLEYTYYSITFDFDGINNDDQNISIHPSFSFHDHINLRDQSAEHKIIYICSFDLCNEKLFRSKALKDFLSSRAYADEYTRLVKYLRSTLYDEANSTVKCYDNKLNLTHCKDGVCYATGDINVNSSFTGYCLRKKDLNENYYVNIEKKIFSTSDIHNKDANNYQLTYTCNKKIRRLCNNLTSFENIYKQIPTKYGAFSDFEKISRQNIFNNSKIKKTSTSVASKSSTKNQYLTNTTVPGKTSMSTTDLITISNQGNHDKYIHQLFLAFSIVLFLLFNNMSFNLLLC